MRKRFGLGLSGVKADVLGAIEHDRMANGHLGGPVAQDKFTFGSQFGGQLGVSGQAQQDKGKAREEDVKAEQMEEEL